MTEKNKDNFLGLESGDSKKINKSKNLSKNVDTNVVDNFNKGLRWVDNNILPMIAMPILCGLAAIGVMSKLNDLTDTSKVIIAIITVAFLAFKCHK